MRQILCGDITHEIDTVVTDPPYGINENSHRARSRTKLAQTTDYGEFNWDKINTGNFADAEMAWTNMEKSVRLKRYMWNGMIRQGEKNVPRVHPTQKPVEVMKWCIDQLPDDVETILDPFMGSGTTGVAALAMGKNFVGIERDERYFTEACSRIQEEYNQLKMF